MNDECLICKAPHMYLEKDGLMECTICHKKEDSKTQCVHGHEILSHIASIQYMEEREES